MDLNTTLRHLARDPSAPLDPAEVALYLARDEYPGLDVEGYLSELQGMAREVRPYLRGSLEQRVAGLCRYLFHEMGFRGNTKHYYDPRNSYLNEVIDLRTGIPITLSVITLAVGRRAGLNVVGVGLPGHFVVKAVAGQQEVLFDPFHGGRRLTEEQCEQLVQRVTGTLFRASPAALEPVPLGPLVLRMLNNLKGCYLREQDYLRAVRVIERLRQLDPDDAVQLRDLGITLLQAGRAGRAIDALEAYLAQEPADSEAETVRQLLNRARSEVARWN